MLVLCRLSSHSFIAYPRSLTLAPTSYPVLLHALSPHSLQLYNAPTPLLLVARFDPPTV